MINSVRNTVLAVCNKNNYGYISPSDFNLFAKQAQLDMFEDYFYQYNYQINKVNAHSTGSSYADIAENLLEVIDSFSVFAGLTHAGTNQYTLPADFYYINRLLYNNTLDVEKVSESKLHSLLNSLLTAPTVEYPAYVVRGNTANLFPSTDITGANDINCQYIRYPKDPKWTYVTLLNGEPQFDQTNADYQDFELPLSDEPMLVNKILQYAGLSIREPAVYQTMSQAEINENNEER